MTGQSESNLPDKASDDAESPCSCRRMLVAATATVGGIGVFGATLPLIASLMPTARQKSAGRPVEVDIGSLASGDMMTVSWRGQPIWILKRTPSMMTRLTGHDDDLADSASEKDDIPSYCRNAHRSRSEHPDLLVVVGLCTHLGCSPTARLEPENQAGLPDGWPGGFLCPCHGSTFDLAGRVFKNKPAPNNLRIPPYRFLSETRIRIGDDETTSG